MTKILIADDSLLIRMMLKTFIGAHRPDWSVVECKNGEEAVRFGAEGGYSLITLDMNMPVMDGMSAAEPLRASNPGALIALVTANIQDGVRLRAEALGLRFVTKPLDDAKIVALLDDCEA